MDESKENFVTIIKNVVIAEGLSFDDDKDDVYLHILVTCFMVVRQWSWLDVMVADGRKAVKYDISLKICG